MSTKCKTSVLPRRHLMTSSFTTGNHDQQHVASNDQSDGRLVELLFKHLRQEKATISHGSKTKEQRLPTSDHCSQLQQQHGILHDQQRHVAASISEQQSNETFPVHSFANIQLRKSNGDDKIEMGKRSQLQASSNFIDGMIRPPYCSNDILAVQNHSDQEPKQIFDVNSSENGYHQEVSVKTAAAAVTEASYWQKKHEITNYDRDSNLKSLLFPQQQQLQQQEQPSYYFNSVSSDSGTRNIVNHRSNCNNYHSSSAKCGSVADVAESNYDIIKRSSSGNSLFSIGCGFQVLEPTKLGDKYFLVDDFNKANCSITTKTVHPDQKSNDGSTLFDLQKNSKKNVSYQSVRKKNHHNRRLRKPAFKKNKRRKGSETNYVELTIGEERILTIEEQIQLLPARVIPPSVLADIVMSRNDTQQEPQRYINHLESSVIVGKRIKENDQLRNNKSYVSTQDNSLSLCMLPTPVSPQETFDEILKNRGYNFRFFTDTEEAQYDAMPSPLQLASYGTRFVWAVETSNISLLTRLLNCNISPNACNEFRDSILFELVCRKDNFPAYDCLVNAFRADLQVADGCGRVPLHHCCWSKNMCREIVLDILSKDPLQVFMKDKQGNKPLQYVRAGLYKTWNGFLLEVADLFWPVGGQIPNIRPPKERRSENGCVSDPPNSLTPELAAKVSNGIVTPEQLGAKSMQSIV